MIVYPNIKLNIGLHIISKRDDGFHNIESLFIPNDSYHDILEVVKYDETCSREKIVFNKYYGLGATCYKRASNSKLEIIVARKEGIDWDILNDLVVKAYEILDIDFNLPKIKICLEKLSPVGAGLGGGSADAAYMLMCLNDIFNLGLSKKDLADYASRLGSDCAFFIYQQPMIARSKGEILSPYPIDLSKYDIKVIVPEGISVATKEAYSNIIADDSRMDIEELLKEDITKWKDLLHNDFEKGIFNKYPILQSIKNSLYESGAIYASMSGSGSSLYAIYAK